MKSQTRAFFSSDFVPCSVAFGHGSLFSPTATTLRRRVSLAAAAILLALLPLGQRTASAQQPWPPAYAQGYGQPPQQNPGGNPSANPQYPDPQYPPDQQQSYGQPNQYDQQPYQPQAGQYPQDYQQGTAPALALNTEQLEQLVAPIALYPDTLVAQMLAAATYPAQVVDADHWRQSQSYASPDQVVAGADAQNWDPSLKALTAFPQVLQEMDQNLRWTIAVGNAYYNQPQDVLDVIQVMRQRAQAAGNLQSTPQESVGYDQGYIQLAPVNPQVVYVPTYDPWSVYGQPIQPYRGFSLIGALGSFFGSAPVRYGLSFAMSAFSHTSFGWLGWGLDWLTHSLLFHNSNYYSHSTTVADWGLPHGGPRAFPQRGSFSAGLSNNPYRSQGYNRPAIGANDYRGYNGFNRAPVQGIVRSPDRFAENRSVPYSYRGYSSPGTAYARPPMEAYNRAPQPIGRPQQYGRPNFGSGYPSGFAGSPARNYTARPNPALSNPQQAYRSPAPVFQRAEPMERSSGFSGGRGFNGYSNKPPKSSSFHSFGGGHEPKFSGGGHNSGFGHAEHGGHSGGFFGGSKHHK